MKGSLVDLVLALQVKVFESVFHIDLVESKMTGFVFQYPVADVGQERVEIKILEVLQEQLGQYLADEHTCQPLCGFL